MNEEVQFLKRRRARHLAKPGFPTVLSVPAVVTDATDESEAGAVEGCLEKILMIALVRAETAGHGPHRSLDLGLICPQQFVRNLVIFPVLAILSHELPRGRLLSVLTIPECWGGFH